MSLPLDTIFVPQGAEYQAVRSAGGKVPVVAIPVGVEAVGEFLRDWRSPVPLSRVLVMGLAGSLSPHLKPGDGAICEAVVTLAGERYEASAGLLSALEKTLQLPRAVACTSDRLVTSPTDKARLHQQTGAHLVEMEAAAVWAAFPEVAMVRVVSDGCEDELPDMSAAINPKGKIEALPVLKAFLGQPRAAGRLISGSLQGLKILRDLARQLASAR